MSVRRGTILTIRQRVLPCGHDTGVCFDGRPVTHPVPACERADARI
ncbi:conserved hypothetical protein [Burkholderia vietnamiensis]|nr:conserved hypothetical protein [Burkholderia vietnamiensis]